MQQSKPISITPKPECKTCDGNGMMKADLVPAPFGRGMIQLPEEYCHCVVDQLPPEGPDVDVEDFEIFLKFPEPKPEPAEEWKPGKCGGAIISNVRGHYDSDGSIEFYGGYLVAESIPSQRYIHLISRAPAMLRLLEKLYPLIEEESERREFVIQDPKFLAEFSDDEKEYYTEMRKALNEIRAEIDRAHGRVDSTRLQEIEVTAQWGEASPENVITVAEPEPAEDFKINADLLEACKAARDVWDSNSASLDPDEVKAMLTDAVEKGEKSPAERSKSLVSAYNAIFMAFEHIEDGNPKQAWRILRTFINEQSSEKETKTDVE